ncbi:hypothetical protein [Listeria seeligeri]|uniref:hypothetical protein n=1 Tax=Listeria seeligeri TaxID=1640 RepID=UPI00311B345F
MREGTNQTIGILISTICTLMSIAVFCICIIEGLPTDQEAKVATEKYVEIKLTDKYKLEAMDYEAEHGNLDFFISYIGVDEKTGDKKEVIEKKVSYSEIEETIAKDKKKEKLEKEAENKAN